MLQGAESHQQRTNPSSSPPERAESRLTSSRVIPGASCRESKTKVSEISEIHLEKFAGATGNYLRTVFNSNQISPVSPANMVSG